MNFLTEDKTNWKYILIVVILAIIVGGGTLWFLEKQELPYQPPGIKKPEKAAENETVNWRTYKNLTYKYEVKYPSDWRVSPSLYKDPKEGDWHMEFSPDVPPGAWFEKFFSIIVSEYSPPSKEKLNACLAGYCADPVSVEETKMTFHGFNGIKRELIYNTDPVVHSVIESYINTNHLFYTLRLSLSGVYEIKPEDRNFYNLFLSTFKFTEEETADWKTYRNEKYGFEIKYPSDFFTITENSTTSFKFRADPHKNACVSSITTLDGNIETISKKFDSTYSNEGNYLDSKKQVFLDGRQAIEYRGGMLEGGLTDIIILLSLPQDSKKTLQLQSCEERDIESNFDQMLSTFKFLE